MHLYLRSGHRRITSGDSHFLYLHSHLHTMITRPSCSSVKPEFELRGQTDNLLRYNITEHQETDEATGEVRILYKYTEDVLDYSEYMAIYQGIWSWGHTDGTRRLERQGMHARADTYISECEDKGLTELAAQWREWKNAVRATKTQEKFPEVCTYPAEPERP